MQLQGFFLFFSQAARRADIETSTTASEWYGQSHPGQPVLLPEPPLPITAVVKVPPPALRFHIVLLAHKIVLLETTSKRVRDR
jgi:hypothetical protein